MSFLTELQNISKNALSIQKTLADEKALHLFNTKVKATLISSALTGCYSCAIPFYNYYNKDDQFSVRKALHRLLEKEGFYVQDIAESIEIVWLKE